MKTALQELQEKVREWREKINDGKPSSDESFQFAQAAYFQCADALAPLLSRLAEEQTFCPVCLEGRIICDGCFYSAWVPVPESECDFVHPHEGECRRCDYCWLKEQTGAMVAAAYVDTAEMLRLEAGFRMFAEKVESRTPVEARAALDKLLADREKNMLRALNETIKMLSTRHAIELEPFSEWPCINLSNLTDKLLREARLDEAQLWNTERDEWHIWAKQRIAALESALAAPAQGEENGK